MFTTAIAAGDNVDRITDFTVNTDRILLDHSIFTAAGPAGTLSASMFTSGAPDADDRIIYNADTGALSYDADGSGSGTAIQFATLSVHLNLTHQDFLVI